MPRSALESALHERTIAGELVLRHEAGRLTCVACAHRCVIADNRSGSCGLRYRRGDDLFVPFGYVARKYVRPIETNTIYHVLPGALALTFGMYGCDLRCGYCHNHRISQALRDGAEGEVPTPITPRELVAEAVDAGARAIVGAYNEPMITAEWAHAIFTEAKRRGLVTAVVSNGNTTEEALRYLRPVLDVFRIDLKGYARAQYSLLGGRLEPVMASIGLAKDLGFWVEVVTLVVPGLNDDAQGLRGLGDAILSVDRDIPWHLNAFYPRYKLASVPSTSAALLLSVAGTALARGLRYVYVGNVARELPHLCHTRCPRCATVLVERFDYRTIADTSNAGACAACGSQVAGIFAHGADLDIVRKSDGRPPKQPSRPA